MITEKQVEVVARAIWSARCDHANEWDTLGEDERISLRSEASAALEAYEAQKMADRPFMCWVWGDDPQNGCVIDSGNPEYCDYAADLSCREQCRYWAQEPPKEE